MIVLDTHIWVWWVHGDPRLGDQAAKIIQDHQADGLGVSVISCWEVAKLVEVGRLALPVPVNEWMDAALAYAGLRLLDLTPAMAYRLTTPVGRGQPVASRGGRCSAFLTRGRAGTGSVATRCRKRSSCFCPVKRVAAVDPSGRVSTSLWRTVRALSRASER